MVVSNLCDGLIIHLLLIRYVYSCNAAVVPINMRLVRKRLTCNYKKKETSVAMIAKCGKEKQRSMIVDHALVRRVTVLCDV